MTPCRIALRVMLIAAWLPAPAAAVVVPDGFVDALVAGDLAEPVNFDFLPDGRILIVERTTARIRVVVPGAAAQPVPVGTIPDVESGFGDQGLLGIAVDPRWPVHPYVYVHHTCAATPTIRVVRYALSGDRTLAADGALELDSLSRREVLSGLPSQFDQHNGGTLAFGPDRMLYVALGDDDLRCSAQDPYDYRGKILRLDTRSIPDGPGPAVPLAALVPPDEPLSSDPDPVAALVWHRGLRNPWSFDFDPVNRAMAIADVGNATWEEIDIVPAGRRNFGWPLYEGPQLYDPACAPQALPNLTAPDYAYPHAAPGLASAVILGGIGRPAEHGTGGFPAEYWGDVFFLDLYAGWLRRLDSVPGGWAIAAPVGGQPTAGDWGAGFEYAPRMRFGADGALWYVQGSELRRISWQGAPVGVPPAAGGGADALRLAASPNPARGAVTVEFSLPRVGAVRLDVIDARGRRVRRLVEDPAAAVGPARHTWDGRRDDGARLLPGVYFVRLAFGMDTVTRRVVLTAAD